MFWNSSWPTDRCSQHCDGPVTNSVTTYLVLKFYTQKFVKNNSLSCFMLLERWRNIPTYHQLTQESCWGISRGFDVQNICACKISIKALECSPENDCKWQRMASVPITCVSPESKSGSNLTLMRLKTKLTRAWPLDLSRLNYLQCSFAPTCVCPPYFFYKPWNRERPWYKLVQRLR